MKNGFKILNIEAQKDGDLKVQKLFQKKFLIYMNKIVPKIRGMANPIRYFEKI
ncbi:hypothetical protein [Flavobacterium sp. GSP6]|uniref:hypothetical protein n=1 Tax=Flavobacterium sp. GSP6 TaxID=2497488 RepID=UPI001F2FE77C|nr:hypothetical protein [Flavobacterium sp. GSP6]